MDASQETLSRIERERAYHNERFTEETRQAEGKFYFAINAYRAVTPNARTPDEHPLLAKDFKLARDYFDDVGLKFYGLTSLATVPVRDTNLGEKLLRASAAADQALKVLGGKWQAWCTLIELRKPRHG